VTCAVPDSSAPSAGGSAAPDPEAEALVKAITDQIVRGIK